MISNKKKPIFRKCKIICFMESIIKFQKDKSMIEIHTLRFKEILN